MVQGKPLEQSEAITMSMNKKEKYDLLLSLSARVEVLTEHIAEQTKLLATIGELSKHHTEALILLTKRPLPMRHLTTEEITQVEASGMVVPPNLLVPDRTVGFQ